MAYIQTIEASKISHHIKSRKFHFPKERRLSKNSNQSIKFYKGSSEKVQEKV